MKAAFGWRSQPSRLKSRLLKEVDQNREVLHQAELGFVSRGWSGTATTLLLHVSSLVPWPK